MKKILFLSNLVWILITALLIANATRRPAKASDLAIQTSPPGCPADEIELMNATSFLKGLARYKEYQLKAIDDKLSNGIMPGNFEDARSCWYSIEKLEEFICLIKNNATKSGWDPATSDLGIRFYYAAYPDTEHQTMLLRAGTGSGGTATINKAIKVPVGMHHTLFMVPTHHDKETNLDEDLYMQPLLKEIPKNENKKYHELSINPSWEKYMNSPQTKLLILGQAAVTSPSAQNQGMLCPPTCPTKVANTLAQADAIKTDIH